MGDADPAASLAAFTSYEDYLDSQVGAVDKAYLEDPATRRALPTRTELQAAGRADLVYALNRHGRRPLAAALRLRPARVRCAKRSFAEARDFARSLRLGSQPAWRDWCACWV